MKSRADFAKKVPPKEEKAAPAPAPVPTATVPQAEVHAAPRPAEAHPAGPAMVPPAAPAAAQPARAEERVAVGEEYEKTIAGLMEMGFPRDQVVKALKAAFNNPDRAAEYLLTVILMPNMTLSFRAFLKCRPKCLCPLLECLDLASHQCQECVQQLVQPVLQQCRPRDLRCLLDQKVLKARKAERWAVWEEQIYSRSGNVSCRTRHICSNSCKNFRQPIRRCIRPSSRILRSWLSFSWAPVGLVDLLLEPSKLLRKRRQQLIE